ncbi:DUF3006 domain-containing protein [Haloarcula nitratireducens]|uniref:DUF3006 domain-containing protein n=1 Tax=Haloarcula nitratireducens TaxID=2487749 RepID=A0AAW4PGJ6_9EURY|nr:DUF3006 domain-containing protein [Halomicroarcula nitratireducens]MBX0297212.1 DUF3006 domain-containing protein [Halomicroarcula nitratireducens]
MIPDGTYTAVVDRIEDELATLEVQGDDERYSLVIDETTLPADARHADAIVELELEDDEPVEIVYQEQETVKRKDEAQNRFDRLSKRRSKDDDE